MGDTWRDIPVDHLHQNTMTIPIAMRSVDAAQRFMFGDVQLAQVGSFLLLALDDGWWRAGGACAPQ